MVGQAALLFVLFCSSVQAQVLYTRPEQIHLAVGSSSDDLVVTWSTFNATDSVVEYGATSLNLRATGSSSEFVDGGALQRSQYIHRVRLSGLQPGQRYMYHVGSTLAWSDLFFFTALRSDASWSPRLAFFGDMGNENAQSLPRLQSETQQGMYDVVIHVGDFAYDMDVDNAQVGDEFMRQIEAIAAYLPYMTCVGNHENAYNFSNYKARFSMPGGDGESMFYSFDLGPAHFIGIATEFYFYLQYGLLQVLHQFRWLENDLKMANENRAERPWIITFGHRPMYCSDDDGDDCTKNESITRLGIPYLHLFGLEKLFYDHGVDLELWAHEHSYERLWPVYDRKVYNGSTKTPYTNPGAPVHIVSGSAGCRERTDHFIKNPQGWSAFRNSDYGYTRMQVFNSTHLYLEQVSDDKGGQVIDTTWLIKDKHGPYPARHRNEFEKSPFDVLPRRDRGDQFAEKKSSL